MPKITIDEKRCKKCGYCVAFCPQKVFSADEKGLPHTVQQDACTACRMCEKRCPDFAIQVEG